MAKHRAPHRLTRRAATPVAALALSAAALTAVAPVASAHPRDDGPSGNGNVGVLNDLTLLPVNACGLQVPILGSILDAPDADCSNTDD
ncbi:hypothetical protein [Actinomycetospora termitidis]|uniref:Chaplin n=1 Tax=Actinomycetospora termitidis TaxID=3053470 RepID=A0ABT7M1L5_9PSEU|nr:hypothetical protein [Actinomycetospora sp. Odt1-22]MDL5154548.1 hypothetical protein [Actinomycetospora sp. Odt1-22]